MFIKIHNSVIKEVSPVKKQFRNARRRFGTANKNILSAIYAQSSAARI